MNDALITNDAVVLGMLLSILGFVFMTSSSNNPFWKKFYSVVPTLLMCYFLPSLLTSFGIIDPSQSQLYFIASRYLLPACLVLLTISVDLKELAKLGPKALIMFVTGTVGVMFGGPIAIFLFSYIAPELINAPAPNEVWRGLSTVAGSWIGGGANQAAIKEVFEVSDSLFSKVVAVDIIVANVWLAILMLGIGRNSWINKKLKADDSSIETLKEKMSAFQERVAKIPTVTDLMAVLAIGFAATAIAHWVSDLVAPYLLENYPFLKEYSLTSGFFWIVVVATTLGVILSFTKARNLEGAGASKIGTIFIYILVATIGMNMDILAIFDDPGLFLVGLVWMMFHAGLMILVARLIKAPFFFIAVGSQANVGGAASAPVVASYFHPSLAPVGVLLAVVGYALGTYGAYLCGLMMQGVTP
ncbi:MAG: putative membrane protein [Cyclobacteriaceae bacterium]|jgi:uncharacterized membrane protein